MEFAEWVPKEVCEVCLEKLRFADEEREDYGPVLNEVRSISGADWNNHRYGKDVFVGWSQLEAISYLDSAIRSTEAEATFYRRMTTDPRAKKVWDVIRSKPIPDDLKEDEVFPIGDDFSFAEHYAHLASYKFNDAVFYPKHTAAERLEHLSDLVRQIRALRRSLSLSPYVSDRRTVWRYLDKQCGLMLGFELHQALSGRPCGKRRNDKWQHADLWSEMQEALTPDKILRFLEEDLEAQATRDPLIKRSTKGGHGDRNRFVRLLHKTHIELFGSPMWELLATVTNVAFDVPAHEEITPNDIRPWFKTGGSYQSESDK